MLLNLRKLTKRRMRETTKRIKSLQMIVSHSSEIVFF